MTCDVCGLVDPYRGQGDGIGSCDCTRCDCGVAWSSALCTCPPDDGPWPMGDAAPWSDEYDPWPEDVILRPVVTVEIPGVSR